MLSDGAAATLLQDKPNKDSVSLRIDWIDIKSYANELKTCMYAGCLRDDDNNVRGWREISTEEQNKSSVFSLKQDARLLQKNIIEAGIRHLIEIKEKKDIKPENIDWFLPHLSSMFFKDVAAEKLRSVGLEISEEKWFLNLPRIGNVGAASAYLMLEELFNGDKFKKGQRILVMVPESARFSSTYMHLTVV